MADPLSSSTAEPSQPSKRAAQRRKKLILWALIGILMIPGVWFGGRAGYRAWRAHQVKSILVLGEKALQDQRWADASSYLRQAYVKEPGNVNTLRFAIKFINLVGGDPAQLLATTQQVMNSGSATSDDEIAYARALMLNGRQAEARRLLDALKAEDKQNSVSLQLEAEILRIEGRGAEAEALLRRALLMDPEVPQNKLRLAVMNLQNTFPETQVAALATIWEIARAGIPESLKAMEILTLDSRLTGEECKDLVDLVNTNPNATLQHRLGILNTYLKLYPQEKGRVINEQEKAIDQNEISQFIPFLAWLHSLGESKRVLQLIPLERAATMREVFPIYAECMIAEQKWKELNDLLEKSASLPIPATDMALLRARCADGLGESRAIVRARLEDAGNHALGARDVRSMQRVAAFAQRLGFDDVAVKFLQDGSAQAQNRMSALEGTLAIQSRNLDAEGMFQTLADMLHNSKQISSVHQENYLYLSVLLGFELETSKAAANTLSEKGVMTDASHKLILALIAYRSYDMNALREALQGIEPGNLPTGRRAVLAGLLSISGDISGGFAIAEKLPGILVLKEEQKFLAKAL